MLKRGCLCMLASLALAALVGCHPEVRDAASPGDEGCTGPHALRYGCQTLAVSGAPPPEAPGALPLPERDRLPKGERSALERARSESSSPRAPAPRAPEPRPPPPRPPSPRHP